MKKLIPVVTEFNRNKFYSSGDLVHHEGDIYRADVAVFGEEPPHDKWQHLGNAFNYEEVTKGDKGDRGDAGYSGPEGKQGLKGDKGDKGEKGDAGPKGKDGLNGKDGQQGPRGLKGDTGPKGKDGLDAPKVDLDDLVYRASMNIGSMNRFRLKSVGTGTSLIANNPHTGKSADKPRAADLRTLVAGSNITITASTNTITIAATGIANPVSYTSPSIANALPYFTNTTGNVGNSELIYSLSSGNPELSSSTGAIKLATNNWAIESSGVASFESVSMVAGAYGDSLSGFDDTYYYLQYGDNSGNFGLSNGDLLLGDIAHNYSGITLDIQQGATLINFNVNPSAGVETAFIQNGTIGGNVGAILTLGDTFNNNSGVGGINFGSGDTHGVNNQIYSDAFDILNIVSNAASVFIQTPNGNTSFMNASGVVIGPNPYSAYGIQIGGGSGYQSGGGVIDIASLSGISITAAGECDFGNGGFTDPSPGAGYDVKCGGTQGGITSVGAINSNGGYLLNNSIIIDASGNATFTSLEVASTTLISTSVNLNNGAASSIGTLTNAPAAGNPTKWIPINDNGTTRYIPTWT